MEVDNWALTGRCPTKMIIFRVQWTSSHNLEEVINFFFFFLILMLHEMTTHSVSGILCNTVLLHELFAVGSFTTISAARLDSVE
jgi:hypothetical protein